MVPPLALLLAAFLLPPAEGDERRAPAWIRCTTTTIEVEGERIRGAENPVARALEEAGPGTVVLLDPGDYPAFTIGLGNNGKDDARTSGGESGFPIVVDGGGSARVLGRGDTIGIDQRRPNGYVTFRGLTLVPGERSAVMFYRQSEAVHRGYSFEDCHILGGYDHAAARGPRSKWGVSAHSVADFRFVGVRSPARIEGIEKEHAFYVQNQRGDVLIENVRAAGLGRTFCQFTARPGEGPPGRGDVTIRDCVVRDACLAAGDGYKGGSAFTFAGRLEGTILLERNEYRAGFDPRYRGLTLAGQPYGTGALVAWQEQGAGAIGALVLVDNRFLFEAGCGDRPVVSIGGCDRVLLLGKNEFRSGGAWPALALDPVDGARRVSPENGDVRIAAETVLVGGLTVAGEAAKLEDLARPKGE